MKQHLLILLILGLMGFVFSSFGQTATLTPLNLTNQYAIPGFMAVPSHDVLWASMQGYVSGLSNSKLFAKTSDAGVTFIIDTIPDPTDRGGTGIFALDEYTAWVGLTDGFGPNGSAIWKTTDGGLNWVNQTTTQFSGNGSFLNVICFFSPNEGVAMGDPVNGNFEIYTSSDGGVNWIPVPAANIPAPLTNEYGLQNDYSSYGSNVWFGTTQGRVYHSSDMGHTWSVSGVIANNQLMGISMHDASNGIAFRINNGASVYITDDGGMSWSNQLLSPPLGVYGVGAIRDVPGLVVFKSTGSGIYYTTNNFQTYFLVDNDLSINNNPMIMYDATIGWTPSADMNDSSMIRIENIPTSAHFPDQFQNEIAIYPNPVIGGSALITAKLDKEALLTFTLTDISGRILRKQTGECQSGNNAFRFDCTDIPGGMYFIEISDKISTVTIKIIVE